MKILIIASIIIILFVFLFWLYMRVQCIGIYRPIIAHTMNTKGQSGSAKIGCEYVGLKYAKSLKEFFRDY